MNAGSLLIRRVTVDLLCDPAETHGGQTTFQLLAGYQGSEMNNPSCNKYPSASYRDPTLGSVVKTTKFSQEEATVLTVYECCQTAAEWALLTDTHPPPPPPCSFLDNVGPVLVARA